MSNYYKQADILDKLIDLPNPDQKDFEQLPGITAIVVEDQEVLWTGAFGLSNVENNVIFIYQYEFITTTSFFIGSKTTLTRILI